jgi:uncharacterized protein YxjI
MENIQYPLDLKFKISTLSNDFVATDATGRNVAYVRQKMFKLREAVTVFRDESRSEALYNIKANKWLDFNTAYAISNQHGEVIGKVARKGWKSFWKVEYHVVDDNEQTRFIIRERNAWTRIADNIVGDIPVLGLFTGYIFHPVYDVKDMQGNVVMLLSKEPSMIGRRFKLKQVENVQADDDTRILLSLMMMILLERDRG